MSIFIGGVTMKTELERIKLSTQGALEEVIIHGVSHIKELQLIMSEAIAILSSLRSPWNLRGKATFSAADSHGKRDAR